MSEFRKKLKAVLESPPYNGRLRAFARDLDIDHSHLAKALSGDRSFSPNVVGRVARLVSEEQAHDLIKSYLRGIAAEIAKEERREPLALR